MEAKVIGSGMIFLGSGCGPVLNARQREYLSQVEPDGFYPLDKLMEMLAVARERRPDLIYAAGRRWGNAVKDLMVERGATSVKATMRALCVVYQDHHQGEVGELCIEDIGECAIRLTNTGPYPAILIAGALEGLALAMGSGDVRLAETEDPDVYLVSWIDGA